MKVVVLLSGGLDSCVLLADRLARGDEVLPLAINYGQRHCRELDAAARVASHYGVGLRTVDLSGLASLLPGSSLTDPRVPVPSGHYAAPSMSLTVVPNRNMVIVSVAAAYAIARSAGAVAYACHAGDHPVYHDCRPAFVHSLGDVLARADALPVGLITPFLLGDKAGIVAHGDRLGAPMGLTWSCYRGGDWHCGTCGTCVERKEAFSLASVEDPTTYAD